MLLPSNSIAFTCPLHITSDTTALTPPRCRTPKTKEMHSVWATKKKQQMLWDCHFLSLPLNQKEVI